MDFNTSHVSINRKKNDYVKREDADFNTSHVSINHAGRMGAPVPEWHFNTSHVSINRSWKQNFDGGYAFQYISCFY